MKVLIFSLVFSSLSFAESKLPDEHKVYEKGGLSKFWRITKNEKAIVALIKEVELLKKEIQLLKQKQMKPAPQAQK